MKNKLSVIAYGIFLVLSMMSVNVIAQQTNQGNFPLCSLKLSQTDNFVAFIS